MLLRRSLLCRERGGRPVAYEMHYPVRRTYRELWSPPASFMNRSFESWRAGYTSYLKSRDMYWPATTKRVDAQQRQRETPRDSAYIGTLRQVFFILEKAYDDRA